tara:strand:- start:2314 stop:2475 length:162 start_codon:yes stop_codon:yes gene_type:complete
MRNKDNKYLQAFALLRKYSEKNKWTTDKRLKWISDNNKNGMFISKVNQLIGEM